MSERVRRQTELPAHVVQFAAYLRDHDFQLGPVEELDYLHAFSKRVPTSSEEQEVLCKALFVKNRKEFLRFDTLYTTYWNQLSTAENSKTKPEKANSRQDHSTPSLQALKDWLHGNRTSDTEEVATYSAFEALSKKDFSAFSKQEHPELRAVIRLLAKRLASKHNRRYIRSHKQVKLDLKNTIRDSMKSGGEIRSFTFHRRKKKRMNLFLLCDVSKSMELYSQFFIEFMYNFQQIDHSLKTFVFSTQLSHITRLLHDGDFDTVLENLSEEVPQWSGGTRIGASLDQFIRGYSHLLNNRSVVMILSDGWDVGDLNVLEDSIAYIQKKSKKIIWLNPLAGHPDYSPSTAGMRACLPYVDVLLPLFNLNSLKTLSRQL